jgi:hypothetical protein
MHVLHKFVTRVSIYIIYIYIQDIIAGIQRPFHPLIVFRRVILSANEQWYVFIGTHYLTRHCLAVETGTEIRNSMFPIKHLRFLGIGMSSHLNVSLNKR